jgi:hypothetical protein
MQFGKQNFVASSIAVAVGSGASDGDYVFEIFAGGNGVVLSSVAFTPVALNTTTAQVIKFWRRPKAGTATDQRAVAINAADGTGATSMTVPTDQAAGDVFRVYFGGDGDEDHVLNPGESLAVELDVAGGSASTGVFTVHGYQFEVGAAVPVKGGLNGLTGDQDKPNSNGAGNIRNLVG